MANKDVDVWVSAEELGLGLKNVPKHCMKIDPKLLQPSQCFSKAGTSTEAMFSAEKARAQAKSRPKSASSLQDYAALFNKYYSQGSVIDRLVAKNKSASFNAGSSGSKPTSRPASARPATSRPSSAHPAGADREHALRSDAVNISEVARQREGGLQQQLDADISTRAVRESRAKFLTSYLANKYGVEGEGQFTASLNPALDSLTVMAVGTMSKELVTTAHDAQGASKVLELAASLQEAERYRIKAAKAAKERERSVKAQMAEAHRPRPASSSFKTTSRDQASKIGSRFVSQALGKDAPGPGKYNIRHKYFEPHVPNTQMAPRQHVDEQQARAEQALSYSDSGAGSPAGLHTLHGSSPPRPASTDRRYSLLQQQQQQGGSPPVKLETSGQVAGEVEAEGSKAGAAKGPILAIFKDAHQVHDRKPPRPGTSSFKATPRPQPDPASTANNLLLQYYHEQYDSLLQKSKKLLTKFEHQTPRPSPGTQADTPPQLGPGSYINSSYMPATWTGRHVEAGHKGIKQAPDFAVQTARPGSAPPAPRYRAQPQQEVDAAAAAAALKAMYGAHGADLDPSDLITIQTLEANCLTSAGPRPRSGRPTSAAVSVGGRSVAATAEGVTAMGLGPEDLEKFSSAGLAKKVPGGRFTHTTRAGETSGMRVMSKDGVTPPASGPLRMGAGADALYLPDDTVQGHRPRSPSWQLPPNRTALSKGWVSAAALTHL
mmetsp:Transcript_22207/g.48492  ORF Transcript_22207/g.48492 Transcript_22207/m.48492 type:complete len:717 (+) Transcript_22207:152-2302(+)